MQFPPQRHMKVRSIHNNIQPLPTISNPLQIFPPLLVSFHKAWEVHVWNVHTGAVFHNITSNLKGKFLSSPRKHNREIMLQI